MSDVIVVAIIAATPALIAALVSYRNSRKADAIHHLVNSQLDAVKAELIMANQEIIRLRKALITRDQD